MVKKLEFEIGADPSEGVAAFNEIAGAASDAADDSQDSFSGISKFAKSTAEAITGVNQALELASKGLSLIKGAVGLAAGAISGLVSTGVELVDAYEVQARATIQLAQSMANQNQLTRESVQEWERWASSVQAATNVGDEQVLALAAQGGAVVGFNEDLQKAVELAIDVAQATNRSFGESLAAFTRASQTGSFELARFGTISLKSADEAGRLKEAIEFADNAFGGFAASAAAVGSGPLDRLRNAIGDLKEPLGGGIINAPAVRAGLDTAATAIERFTTFANENLGDIATVISSAFEVAFQVISATVEGIIASVRSVVDTLSALLQQIPFVDLSTEGEKSAERIKAGFEDLDDGLGGLEDRLNSIKQGTGDAFSAQSLEPLRDAIDDVGDDLTDLDSRQLIALREGFQGVRQEIEELQSSADFSELEGQLERIARIGLRGRGEETGQFALANIDEAIALLDELIRAQSAAEESAEATEAAQSKLDAALARLADAAGDAGISWDELNTVYDESLEKEKNLAEQGTALERQIDALIEKQNAAAAAAQAQTKANEENAASLGLMGAEGEKASNAIAALNSALAQAGSDEDPFGKFAGSLGDVLPAAAEANQLMQGLERNVVSALGSSLDQFEDLRTAADITDAIQRTRDGFKKFGAGAEFELGQVIDLVGELGPAFLESSPGAAEIVERLKEIQTQMQGVAQNAQDALTNMSDPAATDNLKEIEAALNETDGSAEQLAEAMGRFALITNSLDSSQIEATAAAIAEGRHGVEEFVFSMRNLIDTTNLATKAMEAAAKKAAQLDGTTVTIDVKTKTGGSENPAQAAATIETALDGAAERVEDAASAAEDGFGAAADDLTGAADEIGANAASMEAAAGEHFGAAGALEAVARILDSEIRAAARELSASGDRLTDAAEALQRAAERQGQDSGGGGGFGAAVNRLSSAAGSLESAANRMADAASAIVNSEKLQLGGVVTSPTFATVGEAGPEVVIPLNPRGAGFVRDALGGLLAQGGFGGGAGVSVTVTGNTIIGIDELIETIERQVAERVLDSLEVRT